MPIPQIEDIRIQLMKAFLHSITNEQQRKCINQMLSYLSILIFWSNKPKVKYFVFTQSRCGSGLLGTLLNNNHHILVDGEILNTRARCKAISINLYLKARSKQTIFEKKDVYGFKLKLHHLTDFYGLSFDEAKSLVSKLSKEGWKIIYLYRNNILRRSLSSLAARQRKLRHFHGNANKLRKIHVDCEALLERIRESEARVDLDQRILKDIPHLLIEYEKDLLDQSLHSQTCNKVFEYLGIPAVEVETKLTRTSTDDLSRTIENYDEVKATLENTKYFSLLTSS